MPRSPGSTRRSVGERHGACEDRHGNNKRASRQFLVSWRDADFPGLICAMPNWITSESSTIRPERMRPGHPVAI
jgi:hypothetical protein